MSLFKREHAPITDKAWKAIDETTAGVLSTSLKARRFVDVSEPKGWDYSALGLGRLELAEGSPVEEVEYGLRSVQPLVEARVRCELDIWELDNLSRGAPHVELTPLEEAARRAARFEDQALLLGLENAGIEGIAQKQAHHAQPFEHEPDRFLGAVSSAMLALQRSSVGGPFALVVGVETFLFLASEPTGYPLLKRVGALVEGPVLETDLIEGGLLVSLRGNDFQLTVGQDFSVGYETHDSQRVRLFITESFTFRTMEPRAVIRLSRGS
jgi:uncharacterized linocin/CFP29 family protein